ncbi:hypothetical protein ACHAWT_003398, partial [Skeletonema menzelii]
GVYESHYLAGGCAHAFERVVQLDVNDDKDDKKKKKVSFTFDSGPTIVLGCSKEPYNPLQQVLRAVGVDDQVEWIPYDGWGMIEHPASSKGNDDDDDGKKKEKRWKLTVGPDHFENGPLTQFASSSSSGSNNIDAIREFNELREITKPLVTGAATIPAMAMRPGSTALIPLLRYLPSLFSIIRNGVEASTGPFGPYMNGPIFTVRNAWLRDWLDALAFSLSGLPADRTSAGAMAYVLFDMHREGAALDYPKGGLGEVVKALVNGVEQPTKSGSNKKAVGLGRSKVNLRHHVESIDTTKDGTRVVGLTARKAGGKMVKVKATEGVICNAPMWSLRKLIKNEKALAILSGRADDVAVKDPSGGSTSIAAQSWQTDPAVDPKTGRGSVIRPARQQQQQSSEDADNLLAKCDNAEMTGSFLHLHVALDATNLDLDSLEPHYTVMDRGLEGDDRIINGVPDGPCGELNMIAVSNPCVLDRTLAPEGYVIVHAYGAGNEPYDIWKSKSNDDDTTTLTSTSRLDEEINSRDSGDRYQSSTYNALKDARGEALWRAIESIIPDARDRTVLAMLGSPLTHERYLRRPYGSYGAAFEDCLKDGSTNISNLMLAGDGVFPGIGIPAVALSGASAANGMVKVIEQWQCLDELKSQKLIS